jgi:hypothetical protein
MLYSIESLSSSLVRTVIIRLPKKQKCNQELGVSAFGAQKTLSPCLVKTGLKTFFLTTPFKNYKLQVFK